MIDTRYQYRKDVLFGEPKFVTEAKFEWPIYANEQQIMGDIIPADTCAAKKAQLIYIGTDGIARSVKKGWIGDDNGVARLAYDIVTVLLPDAYQRVEWIACNGAGKIDLGFKADQNTGFYVDYINVADVGTSNYGCLFGARTSSNSNDFQITSYATGGSFRSGNSVNITGIGVSLNQRSTHLYRSDGVLVRPDGNFTTFTPTTSYTTPVNVYLGALNNNGTITQYGKFVLFSLKFYNANLLVHDYYPCYEKTSGTIGVYDMIEKKFLSGGTWVKGPDCREVKTRSYTNSPADCTAYNSHEPYLVYTSTNYNSTNTPGWKAFDATTQSTYWQPKVNTATYNNPYIILCRSEAFTPEIMYVTVKGTVSEWLIQGYDEDLGKYEKIGSFTPTSTSAISSFYITISGGKKYKWLAINRYQTSGNLTFMLYHWMVYGHTS